MSKVQRSYQTDVDKERVGLEKTIQDMKKKFAEEKADWEARQSSLVAKLQ